MYRRAMLLVLFCVSVSTIAGCGSDRPSLGSVAGTVSYNGEPIQDGTIIFEVQGTRPATGKIVGGRITDVTTFEPNDGAPIGAAKIAVSATEAAAPAEASTPPAGNPSEQAEAEMTGNYMGMGKSLIPPHFNDPSTSGLTCEIQAGENTVTLELKD